MLTDKTIQNLKPAIGEDGKPKARKVADRDGLYVLVTAAGAKLFRFDYRIHGRRETLALGKYDATRAKGLPRELGELEYGMSLSLAEARLLLTRARRSVESGESPSKAKVDARDKVRGERTFGGWAERYFEDAQIADSTRAMRIAIYNRDLRDKFGNRLLHEISPRQVMDLCEKIKAERNAPATAIHVREIIAFVYRHAQAKSPGTKIENPTDVIAAKDIATFKPRERALSPNEIRQFFTTLDGVGTMPQLKLGLKLILLTALRKGELLGAKWPEVDFEAATWTVPVERMKARKPHVVYLSEQALDVLVGLRTVAGSSPYLLPGRYETGQPMTPQALNRAIEATIEKAKEQGVTIVHFGPHDLRRTFSTLVHEVGFNSDWIEKCLAHEQRGVRAVYNKAEYAPQRRTLLQTWADMVDAFIAGTVTDSNWMRIVELMGAGTPWSEALALLQAEAVVPGKRRAA